MPFDGYTNKAREDVLATSIVARLELLQEIAAKTEGSQRTYRTCLYSEVLKHPVLREIPELRPSIGKNDEVFPVDRWVAAQWFGLDSSIWSSLSIEEKREYIAGVLLDMRVKV